MRKAISIDLHFIGHKAEKIQSLYPTYSVKPNENGYFLEAQNYSLNIPNDGTIIYTNCFESEEEFKEDLFSKLLFNL